ncbi:hypothetical protein GB937_009802 [Aspergillus fischeri]|nr:hypothetical protein GB937_009802 [Aspergillus fischeri]
MLSQARIIVRKLCGSRSRGSEPAPSALATTAETRITDPSPRAIHMSDVRRSPTKLPRKPGADAQSVSIIVMNAKGATDYLKFYRLLQREKKDCSEFDPTDDFETDYYCDGYIYTIRFFTPSTPQSSVALSCIMQHVCLIFTYDASSRESWDEVVTACERMRNRCKEGVLPFLATMIAAMDKGEGEAAISHAEAENWAWYLRCS